MTIIARLIRRPCAAFCCFALLFTTAVWAEGAPPAHTIQNSTMGASIDSDGKYQLKSLSAGWTLDGRLPAVVDGIHGARGADNIGRYQALAARYQAGSRTAEIRIYDSLPIALFRDHWDSQALNQSPFPAFQHFASGLFRFSYREQAFGKYQFGVLGPQGPSALFDPSGHVLLLSPADHFLISQLNALPEGGLSSGIVATVPALPAGFTHATLVAFGDGMNATFTTWGQALLALAGKLPVTGKNSLILSKLGYWTDNGAFYYYKFDPQLGYRGTLLAVRDEFRKLGVPLGYMQIDSWWYPKGSDARWDARGDAPFYGEYLYQADRTLFPEGLAAFQKALSLPIVTHARWVSPASPYHQRFRMSGNVIIDPVFWKATAAYLRDAGVVTYEQDWLNHNALAELNLEDPEAFLDQMSSAMRSEGIDIQYCMPLPAHYMASTLYPNVETIRTSDDRLTPNRWDEFLYDSRLASALGLWPWTDVFYSTELANLMVSTLSAGPVGVGDALGSLNAQNLMAAVRSDGLIIKPDSPLLPVDAVYWSDATNQQRPMVAMAQTKFGDSAAAYVFCYPRNLQDTEVEVPLISLGFSGAAYAYDWVARRGSLIPGGGAAHMVFHDGFAYNLIVPVNRQGLALLGDTEKIVPLGRQRISALDNRDALTATIKFAQTEPVRTISGYAARRPQLRVVEGQLMGTSYDSETKIFQARMAPAKSGEAILKVSVR